jgi:hypothetical protein
LTSLKKRRTEKRARIIFCSSRLPSRQDVREDPKDERGKKKGSPGVVLTQTKTSRVVEGGEKGTRTFWHLFERSEAVERLERVELPTPQIVDLPRLASEKMTITARQR